MRIVFFGTAELACASLTALLQAPFDVLAVVTQPDKPRGRDLALQPSPVKALALARGLPVLQPEKARDPAFLNQILDLRPDLMVVAAYGQILPQALLDIPVFGCLNVHTSLLPKYRGAAPIQWAILDGERETGVAIMKMDAGLDTGPVLSEARTPILPGDNSQTLHDRLAEMGGRLLAETIPAYVAGLLKPVAQVGPSTYARKITKEDGRLDWSLPALTLWNRIRAFTPWPGTFTFLLDQAKRTLIKVWAADLAEPGGPPGRVLRADREGILVACGQGSLNIRVLQKEGGKRLEAAAFLAGNPLPPGAEFEQPQKAGA